MSDKGRDEKHRLIIYQQQKVGFNFEPTNTDRDNVGVAQSVMHLKAELVALWSVYAAHPQCLLHRGGLVKCTVHSVRTVHSAQCAHGAPLIRVRSVGRDLD